MFDITSYGRVHAYMYIYFVYTPRVFVTFSSLFAVPFVYVHTHTRLSPPFSPPRAVHSVDRFIQIRIHTRARPRTRRVIALYTARVIGLRVAYYILYVSVAQVEDRVNTPGNVFTGSSVAVINARGPALWRAVQIACVHPPPYAR